VSPHPFDLWRHGWPLEELIELMPEVDALEVFNARCLRNVYNEKALEFAREQGIPMLAGLTRIHWWSWAGGGAPARLQQRGETTHRSTGCGDQRTAAIGGGSLQSQCADRAVEVHSGKIIRAEIDDPVIHQ